MKVDKLKIIEDVHENINNTNDTNLVLASDFAETISEAFKEDWIRDGYKVTSEKKDFHKDSSTAK